MAAWLRGSIAAPRFNAESWGKLPTKLVSNARDPLDYVDAGRDHAGPRSRTTPSTTIMPIPAIEGRVWVRA